MTFGFLAKLAKRGAPAKVAISDYGADDCAKIALAFAKLGLVNNLDLVSDFEGKCLPVRNQIYSRLRAFLSATDRQRPKIFYFAGHGISLHDALHICPRDYDARIPDKSAIDVSEIVGEFAGKSPWCLFIFDCCRIALKAPVERARQTPHFGGGIRINDNSLVMFGCSSGQYSFEAASIGGSIGGGIFTHYLVDGLQRRFIRRQTNRMSIMEWFAHARDHTTLHVSDAAANSQTPRLIGAQGSDFFLVRATRSALPAVI